jgi:phosphate transport system substrate-binding protein
MNLKWAIACAWAGFLAGAASGQVLINGAGATLPYPVYSKWFDEYHKLNPGIQFNYQSLGSGAGIRQVTDGTVDFGASDTPMTEEQVREFAQRRGFGILHFPSVLGGVVPVYNVPGVPDGLNFTGEALAGIFLGKITRWNDPAIAGPNPGVKLPAADIIVVHRSDGSGTTFVWTDYLSKVSPQWSQKPGRGTSILWPTGLGAKGSEGVTGLVKLRRNSIGYAELTYAIQTKINAGRVQNKSGNFVSATLNSITQAAAGAPIQDDFRVSITDAPGANAYPISSFTWLLIPEKIAGIQKKQAIQGFLRWMLGPGQKMAMELDYAPLPASLVVKEEKAIARIK